MSTATKRTDVWSTIEEWIETGRADRCSLCNKLFLDGDKAVGGTAADGRVHYTCTGCVHMLQTIDGYGIVQWPVRGRA
jgi:hypothetical protein